MMDIVDRGPMTNQPNPSPYRGHRTPGALPLGETRTPEGARAAYRRLAAQLDILSWTIDEPLFLDRERWVWDQLLDVARARGLLELVEGERTPPGGPAPGADGA